MTEMSRRDLLKAAALAGAVTVGRHARLLHATDANAADLSTAPELAPKVTPISDAERLARIEKARRLMIENGMDAMLLEGGTSMYYYTGVRWGNSERPFAVVIPARGELAWVTPGFEEQRARELIKFSNDIRVWQEDENPYRVIAGILRDRGECDRAGDNGWNVWRQHRQNNIVAVAAMIADRVSDSAGEE